jgi:hypothetical protein
VTEDEVRTEPAILDEALAVADRSAQRTPHE